MPGRFGRAFKIRRSGSSVGKKVDDGAKVAAVAADEAPPAKEAAAQVDQAPEASSEAEGQSKEAVSK